jgi:hypothetical protein
MRFATAIRRSPEHDTAFLPDTVNDIALLLHRNSARQSLGHRGAGRALFGDEVPKIPCPENPRSGVARHASKICE